MVNMNNLSEEEKKAVEFVKKRTKELKKYAKRENELVYDDIILNLIEKLQEENKEKDKIIDLLIKELYTKAHISTRCYLQTSTEECMKYKNCYECLKKHFENKERRNNGKGN